jgi:Chlorophyll A-B binding protein
MGTIGKSTDTHCEMLHQIVNLCYICTHTVDIKQRLSVMAQESKVGFTQFAETWNGRLAMIGFVVGLATEFLTGQGILSQIGLM